MAKSKPITIKDRNYHEQLIWMSYRYCVGRSSISSHSHAGDIAKYSFDYLEDNSKQFMARDIRSQINDVIKWNNQISIRNNDFNYDSDYMSDLLYAIKKLYKDQLIPFDIDTGYDFNLNIYSSEDIECDLKKKNNGNQPCYTSSLRSIYNDLIPWIKLANACDVKNYKKVITNYEGKIEEHICFDYPIFVNYQGDNGFTIDKRYIDIESYKKNPHINRYIDPEYIVDIKEVE